MPDRFKEKIHIRVNALYSALAPHVHDGEFWDTFPQGETLLTAWETSSITIPTIPLYGKHLALNEHYDENGDVQKFKYIIADSDFKQICRYDTADDEHDRDHVHRYAVPGDHSSALKNTHPRPDIPELIDEIKHYSSS